MKIERRAVYTGIILAIILTIWLRLLLLLIGYNLSIRIEQIPLTTEEMAYSQNIPTDKTDRWYHFVQPLHRFDALLYEQIAKTNYQNNSLTTVFFPLYPWVVNGLAKFIAVTYPISAFIINTVLTALVFFLLYYLTYMDHPKKIAVRTVLIYATFPAAFFLLTPYAEPLFFVFVLLALIFAKKNRLLPTVVTGSLAAMTKSYGVVIVLPLMMLFITKNSIKQKLISILLLLLVPLSFLGVIKYQDHLAGSSFSIFQTYDNLWKGKIPMPLTPLLSQLEVAFNFPFDLPNDVNLIVVIVTIVFLLKTYRKISRDKWVLVFVFFLIFYLYLYNGRQLFSVSRHALIFFPLFTYLAKFKIDRSYEVIYIGSSVFLMVMFFIWYTLGFFVA